MLQELPRLRLAYRMASISGDWDVPAMLARLSPEQMDWWEAFDALEPIGRDPLRKLVALLIQAIYATKGQETRLEDLLPWTKEE